MSLYVWASIGHISLALNRRLSLWSACCQISMNSILLLAISMRDISCLSKSFCRVLDVSAPRLSSGGCSSTFSFFLLGYAAFSFASSFLRFLPLLNSINRQFLSSFFSMLPFFSVHWKEIQTAHFCTPYAPLLLN